jgi:hypothetical protein
MENADFRVVCVLGRDIMDSREGSPRLLRYVLKSDAQTGPPSRTHSIPGYALTVSCLSSRNLCSDDNTRLSIGPRKHVRWAQCNWCKRMGAP